MEWGFGDLVYCFGSYPKYSFHTFKKSHA